MSRRTIRTHTTPENNRGDRVRRRPVTTFLTSAIMLTGLVTPTANAESPENEISPVAVESLDQHDAFYGTESLPYQPLPAGSITDFYVPQGRVSLINLTMTEAKAAGWSQVISGGVGIGQTSNANASFAGETIATAALVMPNQNGKASVYNQVSTHMIVDQQGSFSEGVVEVVTPKRMYDSRTVGPRLKQGSKTVIGGFKPNSTAVINITTTDTLCDGYIQFMDSVNGPVGTYSNANASRGNTTPKIAVIKTNVNGEAVIYSSCETHIVVDLQAYMNGVDDIADERVVDTRETRKLGAGSVLEFSGRPNSIAMVSVLTLNSRGEGYVQALPVENPIIGSSSNMNMRPGAVIGGFMLVQIGADGKGRIFFMQETDAVVDIQGYLASSSYTATPERLLDTRNGTESRPNIPVCNKVAVAVGATATGSVDNAQYLISVIGPNGTFESYPAPDMNLANSGSHYAIDPSTCNNPGGPTVVYAVGDYPRAELFSRNLATGMVTKVPTIAGKFERPDPQPGGLTALMTETAQGGYSGRILDVQTGASKYEGSVIDYSFSDNDTTKAFLSTYYARNATGGDSLYYGVAVQRYNPATKQDDYYYFQSAPASVYSRIIDVETSPGGETVAVLRNNGSPIPEIVIASPAPNQNLTMSRVDLPGIYQPIGLKLVDARTAVVAVLDNGPTGPLLRTLYVDVISGNYVTLSTGPSGIPIDIAI